MGLKQVDALHFISTSRPPRRIEGAVSAGFARY
jgi:hypothetical protein